jgi:hypothetical protein
LWLHLQLLPLLLLCGAVATTDTTSSSGGSTLRCNALRRGGRSHREVHSARIGNAPHATVARDGATCGRRADGPLWLTRRSARSHSVACTDSSTAAGAIHSNTSAVIVTVTSNAAAATAAVRAADSVTVAVAACSTTRAWERHR